MKTESIRNDLIKIIEPLFGKSFVNTLDKLYYSDTNPNELIELGRKLLGGYLGEEAANQLIGRLLKKYKLKSTFVKTG